MKDKKVINANYGILVILMFTVICTLADYIIIDRSIRIYESNNNVSVEDNGTSCINTNVNNGVVSDTGVNAYANYVNKVKADRELKFNDYSLYRSTVDSKIIDGYYNVELSKNGELSLEYSDGSRVIASDVINYYLINVGQDSGKILYFINEDGTVGKASNIEYNYTGVDGITVENNIKGLKNIVTIVEGSFSEDGMSGVRGPVFIDIDGSIYLN